MDLPGESKYAGGETSADDVRRPLSVFGKLSYEHPTVGTLGVDVGYQRLDARGEFQDFGVLTHRTRIDLDNLHVRGRIQRDLGTAVSAQLSAAYARGGPGSDDRLALNQQGLGDHVTRDMGYDAFDLAGEMHAVLESGDELVAGVDHTETDQDLQTYFRHFAGQPPRPTSDELGRKTFADTGLYLQGLLYPFVHLDVEALEALGLTAGFRHDFHNVYDDVFTYRIGSVFETEGHTYLKLLYGTSYKAPASLQLFTTPLFPGDVIGNPDLEPEEARTLELQVGNHALGDLGLSVTGFYTVVEDKVELVASTATSATIAQNVAEIESVGVEGEARYRSGPLGGYLNVSWQKSEAEVRDPVRGASTQDTRLYPSSLVQLGLDYTWSAIHLVLAGELTHVSPRIASDQNIRAADPVSFRRYELDAYTVVDATVSSLDLDLGLPGPTRIRAKVRNLLDETYAHPGFRDFDIPALGRSLELTIEQDL